MSQPSHPQRPTASPSPAMVALAPQRSPDQEEEVSSSGLNVHFLLFNATPSWMVSGIFHCLGLVILALITINPVPESDQIQTVALPAETMEEVKDFIDERKPLDMNNLVVSNLSRELTPALLNDSAMVVDDAPPAMDVDEAAPPEFEPDDFSEEVLPQGDARTLEGYTGNGLEGRGEQGRLNRALTSGGSRESEAAVARALVWLAAHQQADGGWNFDHRTGPCNGRCGEAGRMTDCRTGATAMALLPFLGAGQTHKQGQYKEVVRRGLYFLVSQMKVQKQEGLPCGDLAQGSGGMYSHGLASIALCEAYAMTQDKTLREPAQLSLNHIMFAQDPRGGGWRYQPKQAGDTSVVGWQLMALKSGHMAYLHVEPETIQKAIRFLDWVGAESGAFYGYTDPGRGNGTTAVGLLCRMHLGWKRDNPGLQRGVEFLSTTGPSKTNLYYDYYATQVMHQHASPAWEKWNQEMRDWLIATQDKHEHQAGSWHVRDELRSQAGGRIYCTAMATMILEVYYRHLPLYTQQATEDDFPLD